MFRSSEDSVNPMTRSKGCNDFSSYNDNIESEHRKPMLYEKRQNLRIRESEIQQRLWKLNHKRISSPTTDSVKSLIKHQKNHNQGKREHLKSKLLESINESHIKEFQMKQHNRSKNNEPTWGYFVDSNSTY